MHNQKPQALRLNGRPYYTLTSYAPVAVEAVVPYVSDDDVERVVIERARQLGGTRRSLFDPDWVRAHFPEAKERGVADVYAHARAQLEEEAQGVAHDQAFTRASHELAKRLCQEVSPEDVKSELRALLQRYPLSAGGSVEEQLRRSGLSWQDLAPALEDEAREVAECGAALDAYARELHLTVTEEDFARFLDVQPDQVDELVASAKNRGTYDTLYRLTLRNKAGQHLLDRSKCTYHHQTRQEAEAARARRQRGAASGPAPRSQKPGGASGGKASAPPSPPNLSLV